MRLFVTSAILLSASLAFATETGDTIANIGNPKCIKIISSPNHKVIVIEGREGQPDYRLTYESATVDTSNVNFEESLLFAEPSKLFEIASPFSKKTRPKQQNKILLESFCDIYGGAVIPREGDRGFDRVGWEIGMLNFGRASVNITHFGTQLSLGLGWQYRQLTVGDGLMLMSDNGRLQTMPINPDYDKVKSTLKSFAIQLPLTITQKIYRAFAFEFGGVAVFNTYTTAVRSWQEGDISSKISMKNLHQRILTVDAFVRIGWRNNVAFYFRYSPMSQFKSGYGPKYESISTGLTIGF